jgi:hypothetical protein
VLGVEGRGERFLTTPSLGALFLLHHRVMEGLNPLLSSFFFFFVAMEINRRFGD